MKQTIKDSLHDGRWERAWESFTIIVIAGVLLIACIAWLVAHDDSTNNCKGSRHRCAHEMSEIAFVHEATTETTVASSLVCWPESDETICGTPAQYDEAAARGIVQPLVPDTVPCVEDDPCWDCRTMGNHLCGKGDGVALLPHTL